jgi:hypothetical protein
MQRAGENCKTSIHRFDSDRRLWSCMHLRPAEQAGRFSWGGIWEEVNRKKEAELESHRPAEMNCKKRSGGYLGERLGPTGRA